MSGEARAVRRRREDMTTKFAGVKCATHESNIFCLLCTRERGENGSFHESRREPGQFFSGAGQAIWRLRVRQTDRGDFTIYHEAGYPALPFEPVAMRDPDEREHCRFGMSYKSCSQWSRNSLRPNFGGQYSYPVFATRTAAASTPSNWLRGHHDYVGMLLE